MATILAYTSPALGHLFPFSALLSELSDRGHNDPSAHVIHGCGDGTKARFHHRSHRSANRGDRPR